MLKKEPEMLQTDAFCDHTIQQMQPQRETLLD